jgi:hypothetical protein
MQNSLSERTLRGARVIERALMVSFSSSETTRHNVQHMTEFMRSFWEKCRENVVTTGAVIESITAAIDTMTCSACVSASIRPVYNRCAVKDGMWGSRRGRTRGTNTSRTTQVICIPVRSGMTRLNAYVHKLTTRLSFSSMPRDSATNGGTAPRNKRYVEPRPSS